MLFLRKYEGYMHFYPSCVKNRIYEKNKIYKIHKNKKIYKK